MLAAFVGTGFGVGPGGHGRGHRRHRALQRVELAQARSDRRILGETELAHLFGREQRCEQVPDRVLHHHPQRVQTGGGGLHPGRTGDRLRAGGQVDLGDARMLDHRAAAFERQQHIVGVVVDEPGLGWIVGVDLRAAAGGADHRRGLAAFGDREHHVVGADAVVLQLQAADQLQVLEAFQRADQGAVAAGDLAAHTVLDPGQGSLDLRPGRQRRRALPERPPQPAFQGLCQAAGGAGAVEVHAMAIAQRVLHRLRGLFQPGQAHRVVGHRVHGAGHVAVHREQCVQAGGGVGGDAPAQVHGLRMPLFGQQGVQLELLLVVHVVHGFHRGLDAEQAGHRGRLAGLGPGRGGDCQHHQRVAQQARRPQWFAPERDGMDTAAGKEGMHAVTPMSVSVSVSGARARAAG